MVRVTGHHWRIQGAGGAIAPLAAWASTQNALKVAIFRLKIEKNFLGRGNAVLSRTNCFLLRMFYLFVTILRFVKYVFIKRI